MAKKLKIAKPNDKYIGVFPLEFSAATTDDDEVKDDAQAIPSTIHLIPVGEWGHDLYGPILINNNDIREFVQNFNAGVRKGVFITAGHEGFEELPAVAWITKVYARADGLWGDVEWNESGRELLEDKAFKFFSPEFCRDYEDPQTHQIYRNVLTGGALTKSPYFKELEAIVFSDKILKKQFNDNKTMDLKALLEKKIEELTAEETAFIKEHKAELTDEQKTALTSILDIESEEDKVAREKAEADAVSAKATADAEAANVAAGLNPDGTAKTTEPIQASDKNVTISASELAVLRQKADQGHQAFAELEKVKLTTAVDALVFTDSNKAGTFLPKSKDNLRAFMETLNAGQRVKFSALVTELPKTQIFKEVGSAAATDGSTEAELKVMIDAKIAKNPTMKYSEALKQVMAENKGFEERYDAERTNSSKVIKA